MYQWVRRTEGQRDKEEKIGIYQEKIDTTRDNGSPALVPFEIKFNQLINQIATQAAESE